MEIIVLHNRYNNEPIIIRVSAINVIQKRIDVLESGKKAYTEIAVGNLCYDVKEDIDVVMSRIKAVENKYISRKESE